MAIANAICTCKKCGAQFEIRRKKYNRKAADDFEAWAPTYYDTCPKCYQAEKEEAIEAASAGLPELIGSEKQVAWAKKIRSELLFAEDRKHFEESIQALVLEIPSAKWWIETCGVPQNTTWYDLCTYIRKSTDGFNADLYRKMCEAFNAKSSKHQ